MKNRKAHNDVQDHKQHGPGGFLENSIKPRSKTYEHQQRETDEHTQSQNNLLEFSA